MKKSICIEKIFLEVDFYDRFKCVSDAGFEYVEFWTWPSRDIPRIKALCEKYNLKVASISGDRVYSAIINEEREGFLEYLGESIKVAKTLGCKHLVMHSNAMDEKGNMTVGAEFSYAKKIASMTRTYCEAAKLAEEAGVTLVLEAVNNISKPGYFLNTTVVSGDIVRVVGSPNVKILYDIWHMQQMEGNMVYHLKEYIDVLGYVHIGDTPERNEPGTGEINFDKIKKVLSDLKYDGIFGFELSPAENSDKCAKILKAF